MQERSSNLDQSLGYGNLLDNTLSHKSRNVGSNPVLGFFCINVNRWTYIESEFKNYIVNYINNNCESLTEVIIFTLQFSGGKKADNQTLHAYLDMNPLFESVSTIIYCDFPKNKIKY